MNVRIQFRRYNGQGDVEDPKTGEPIVATPESILALLNGRSVSGIGGVSADTETVVINFSDGTAVWFVTTHGTPRLLFQKYPLKP
jgi:hypothetical protein